MKKIFVPLFALLLATGSLSAQSKNNSYLAYIEQYKDIAVREMNAYGIPASITLAQGLLESGAGNSELTLKANNHFGIKCQKNWTGEAVYHDDDAAGECFRKYNTALESYEDHSKFLAGGSRYASLFELPSDDYKGWAQGLKKAGYATDPTYATRLIDLIDKYQLHVYDAKTTPKSPEKLDAKTQKLPEEKPKKEEKKKEKKGGFFSFLKKKPKADPVKDSLQAEQNKVFADKAYISEISPFKTHEVQKINGVKYVIASDGDTYESIADEFGLFEREVRKANEVQYGVVPKAGDIVFLAKKKKKGENSVYVAQAGETVYSISQKMGIRVRILYKLNNLIYGKQINEGDVIKLR